MKRQRQANFSSDERDILISLMENHKGVIENKKTDGITIEEKSKAWSEITMKFNALTPNRIHRSEDSLKTFYKNLKKNVRKKAAEHQKETYLTGGGAPPHQFSDEDDKLLSIINKKSVFGLNNQFDSDEVGGEESNEDENVDNNEDFSRNDKNPKEEWKKFKASDFHRPINEALLCYTDDYTAPRNAANIEIIYEQDQEDTEGSSRLEANASLPNNSKKHKFEASRGQPIPKQATPSGTPSIRKVSRHRPTTIKTLTSSALGEKYEILADKKIELADCLKKEHALRIISLELDIELKQKQLQS